MITGILAFLHHLSNWILQTIKPFTIPTSLSLAVGALTDIKRSRTDLIVENALLRQQLIVLKRQVKRPKFSNGDRLRLVLIARFTKFWQEALHIVQPDTLLRWHRELFRLYWRHKSNNWRKKPHISKETIDLIKMMANENRLWGGRKDSG